MPVKINSPLNRLPGLQPHDENASATVHMSDIKQRHAEKEQHSILRCVKEMCFRLTHEYNYQAEPEFFSLWVRLIWNKRKSAFGFEV